MLHWGDDDDDNVGGDVSITGPVASTVLRGKTKLTNK